jgi:hypothetical protein
MDTWLLTIAIFCAIAYGGVIAVLLWNNPQNRQAWLIAGGALILWPALFFMSAMQLIVVIPLVTLFTVNGLDVSKPVSIKAICWTLLTTLGFIAIVSVVAVLHDSGHAGF